MLDVVVPFDIGTASDVGLVREGNEDAWLAIADGLETGGPASDVLIAVADGMGGHAAGEVASRTAVEALRDACLQLRDRPRDQLLLDAVIHANRAVWEAASRNSEHAGMGTTLVCALLSPTGEAIVVNVGDSRAYVVDSSSARQVTTDHSWVVEQVQAGAMTPEEAATSPYRNVLTRSLGVAPAVEADLLDDVRLAHGQALVLCSDGVSGYLRGDDLPQVVGGAPTAQEAADALVRLAVSRGGADNATVVVARALM